MSHLLVLTLTAGVLAHFISITNGACGPDLQSSMDIVKVLCEPGNHEEDIAHLIFGCYLGAQIFGNTVSSKANLDSFCNQIPQMADYNNCLVKAFEANGLTVNDLITQGTVINGCQGDIMGTCAKLVAPPATTVATTTAATTTAIPILPPAPAVRR